jgi:ribose/xylose/arabinose/galactoside ABC-type transport system permease subunit
MMIKKFLRHELSGMLLIIIVMSIIVGSVNRAFFSQLNLINILRQMSFLVIAGIGMTFVLITGGIDLSVGSLIGLGGMVTGLALTAGIPVVLSILLGMFIGLVFGFINGFIIVKFDIPPLIVTLGSLYTARGIINVLTHGNPIYPFPDAFNYIGTEGVFGIPFSVIIMVALTIMADIILKNTVYGRSLYAIGGNEKTARVSGINVGWLKISTYMVVSTLAALVGILMSARTNSAVPSNGTGWELRVVAIVIIGGTSLFGGVGNIWGSFLGAAVLSILSVGLVLIGVDVYWQNIIVGIIIVLTVGFDRYKRSNVKKE